MTTETTRPARPTLAELQAQLREVLAAQHTHAVAPLPGDDLSTSEKLAYWAERDEQRAVLLTRQKDLWRQVSSGAFYLVGGQDGQDVGEAADLLHIASMELIGWLSVEAHEARRRASERAAERAR